MELPDRLAAVTSSPIYRALFCSPDDLSPGGLRRNIVLAFPYAAYAAIGSLRLDRHPVTIGALQRWLPEQFSSYRLSGPSVIRCRISLEQMTPDAQKPEQFWPIPALAA
jgi:hypothetical protein